ncbi:MAG: NOP5/NOP56 family protein [Promethearchaeota archaeon]
MKCYIIDTLFGIFAINDTGTTVNFLDFNDNNENIINFYKFLESNILLEDYKNLIIELKNSGFNEFIFDNRKLEQLTSDEFNFKTKVEINSLEFKNFRLDLENQLKKIGINRSKDDLLKKYKKVSQSLIKNKISQITGQNDAVIIQIIETLEIIKKVISLFSSRLREWYGLYFPELTDKLIEDNLTLAKLVLILGKREKYTEENILKHFDFEKKKVKLIQQRASESMGANFDLTIIQSYANQIISLDSFRNQLENHLEDLMEKTAPNLKAIIGTLIGAKLISKAGSLKKLAYMPASRIQLLGAEKALYRFLRTGENRPKHGLIFQWNQIRSSQPWIRGKVSRIIAGKIGLASKIDYFSGNFIGNILSQDIEEKIKNIEKKYPKPPKKVGKKRKIHYKKEIKKKKDKG